MLLTMLSLHDTASADTAAFSRQLEPPAPCSTVSTVSFAQPYRLPAEKSAGVTFLWLRLRRCRPQHRRAEKACRRRAPSLMHPPCARRDMQRDREARLDAKAAAAKQRSRAIRADEEATEDDDLDLPPWRRRDLATTCRPTPLWPSHS